MVTPADFGVFPPRTGRADRVGGWDSSWVHTDDIRRFRTEAYGPSYAFQPFDIAARPDAGGPPLLEMASDENLFLAEMNTDDEYRGLLRAIPPCRRQAALPRRVYRLAARGGR